MRNEEYTWELKEIFPSELRVDERYQRNIKDSQVKRAIGEFNINIINPPKVNRRDDGHYYIMDGDIPSRSGNRSTGTSLSNAVFTAVLPGKKKQKSSLRKTVLQAQSPRKKN